MTRFDGFDTALLFSGIALIACAALLGITGSGGAGRLVAVTPDHSTRQALAEASRELESGRAGACRDQLQALASRCPGVAEAHVLLGRAFVELGDYPSSVRAFRTSLQLEPEFADPKSEKFAGKAIRASIAGGIALAKSSLARDPADQGAKRTLRDAHYLERMLAGGCE